MGEAKSRNLLGLTTRWVSRILAAAVGLLLPVQSSVQRFENDGSGIGAAVRLAEADLEEIQFTKLLDEQRPAAIFRLDELRAAIEDARDV